MNQVKCKKAYFVSWVIAFLFFCITPTYSQTSIEFLQDSMKLGEPIECRLVHIHTPEKEILFPDSSYNFSPFEYISHTSTSTHTYEGKSHDTITYQLACYDISPEQQLLIPVFEFINRDTSKHFPKEIATIFFKPTITQYSDTLSIQHSLDFLPFVKRNNLSFWSILIGIILLINVIIFALLFKKINRIYKKHLLKKQYNTFYKAITNLNPELSTENTLKVLHLWKKYMEQTSSLPYKSATSKEVCTYHPSNRNLKDVLEKTDALIYGGITVKNNQLIETLLPIAQKAYKDKRQSLNPVKKQ